MTDLKVNGSLNDNGNLENDIETAIYVRNEIFSSPVGKSSVESTLGGI